MHIHPASQIPLTSARARRGGVLVISLVVAASLGAMSFAVLAVATGSRSEQRVAQEELQAQYVAEAGLADAVVELNHAGDGVLGSANAPVDYGDSSYYVGCTAISASLKRLDATGIDGRASAGAELVAQRVVDTLFNWAVFGDVDLHLDSNSFVDSYDATAGLYAPINGPANNKYANANATIGSNEDVLLEQNSHVMGSAAPGPESTASVLGNATVSGSTMCAESATTLPPVVTPVIASSGNLTVNGTKNLAAGNYRYENTVIKGNSKLRIAGPAKVVFKNLELKSTAQFEVEATNGEVQVWIEDDLIIGSNTLIASTTKKPTDIEFNLLSDNVVDPLVVVDLDEIDFNSNAKMYGTIYAPNAHVEIDSNFELYGALVAHSVDLDSNCKVHYDESLALGDADDSASWKAMCWRIVR